MNIGIFATDRQLEINGAWHPIGMGARILVARDNNPKYIQALRTAMEPYRTPAQRAELSGEEGDKLLCGILARTILLGWENIQDEDKVDLPYTHENAEMVLNKYPEFRSLVISIASNADKFRTAAICEAMDEMEKQ